MKILTKEEEDAHYSETVKGGTIGGLGGLAVGTAGLWGASKKYHAIKGLTLPFRVFLIASVGTFSSIISADHYSRAFEASRYKHYTSSTHNSSASTSGTSQPLTTRARTWALEHRYPLLFGAWVLSMGASFALVSRNRYLSTSQKLVQARVYAQGFTLAALLGSFAFEASDGAQGKGRWETVRYLDPADPEHRRMLEKRVLMHDEGQDGHGHGHGHRERYEGEDQWRDMIEAEEQRLKEREKHHEEAGHKKGRSKKNHKEHEH